MELYINGKIADLGDIISIPYIRAIEDFENPTSVNNSYSETISLPITDRNAQIFDNIDINGHLVSERYDFNNKIEFELYDNEIRLEKGYVRFIDVTDGYNVELYGELGDLFNGLRTKEDGTDYLLSDLDWNCDKDTQYSINANTVRACFVSDLQPFGIRIWDIIRFMPSLQEYEDFDTSTALYKPEEPFPSERDGYTTINGYALAKLEEDYTEWQMKDLRSYKQKPVLRVKEMISAVLRSCDKQIELDNSFFNDKNPYYEKAFITLPTLEWDNIEDELGDTVLNSTSFIAPSSVECIPVDNEYVEYINGVIHTKGGHSKVEIPIDFEVEFETEWDELSTGFIYDKGMEYDLISDLYEVKIIAYNQLGDLKSDYIRLMGNYGNNGETTANDKYGTWKRQSNGKFKFFDYNGFPVTAILDKVGSSEYNIRTEIKGIRRSFGSEVEGTVRFCGNYGASHGKIGWWTNQLESGVLNGKITGSLRIVSSSVDLNRNKSLSEILTSERTVLEYFLDYIKIFGLRIWRDDDIFRITALNNYYIDEVIDWEDRIGEYSIKPYIYDKRFYEMKWSESSNDYFDRYEASYKIPYGYMKIDTGYGFNSESGDIENGYSNGIMVKDASKYYNRFYCNGNETSSPVIDGFTYTLYKGEEELEIVSYDEFTNRIDNESFELPEMLFHDDGGTLVFWNERIELPGFYLTDDTQEMLDLNEEACWIMKTADPLVKFYIPRFTRFNDDYTWDFGIPRKMYCDGLTVDYNESIYRQFWEKHYNERLNINAKVVTSTVNLEGINVTDDLMRKFYYFNNSYWIINRIEVNYGDKSNGKIEWLRVEDKDNYLMEDYKWTI